MFFDHEFRPADMTVEELEPERVCLGHCELESLEQIAEIGIFDLSDAFERLFPVVLYQFAAVDSYFRVYTVLSTYGNDGICAMYASAAENILIGSISIDDDRSLFSAWYDPIAVRVPLDCHHRYSAVEKILGQKQTSSAQAADHDVIP
jgi:hypothetical protein